MNCKLKTALTIIIIKKIQTMIQKTISIVYNNTKKVSLLSRQDRLKFKEYLQWGDNEDR